MTTQLAATCTNQQGAAWLLTSQSCLFWHRPCCIKQRFAVILLACLTSHTCAGVMRTMYSLVQPWTGHSHTLIPPHTVVTLLSSTFAMQCKSLSCLQGVNALHVASSTGNIASLKLLLKAGAAVGAYDNTVRDDLPSRVSLLCQCFYMLQKSHG